MKKEWETWKCFNADIDTVNIEKRGGVYVFVVKDKFELNLEEFNSEVTGTFCVDGENVRVTVGVSPCNKEKISAVEIGDVFYVGSAKNVNSRLNYHLYCRKINNTVALKLGFNTRSYVKKYLMVYYCICDFEKGRDLERNIRKNHNVIFGK